MNGIWDRYFSRSTANRYHHYHHHEIASAAILLYEQIVAQRVWIETRLEFGCVEVCGCGPRIGCLSRVRPYDVIAFATRKDT